MTEGAVQDGMEKKRRLAAALQSGGAD